MKDSKLPAIFQWIFSNKKPKSDQKTYARSINGNRELWETVWSQFLGSRGPTAVCTGFCFFFIKRFLKLKKSQKMNSSRFFDRIVRSDPCFKTLHITIKRVNVPIRGCLAMHESWFMRHPPFIKGNDKDGNTCVFYRASIMCMEMATHLLCAIPCSVINITFFNNSINASYLFYFFFFFNELQLTHMRFGWNLNCLSVV